MTGIGAACTGDGTVDTYAAYLGPDALLHRGSHQTALDIYGATAEPAATAKQPHCGSSGSSDGSHSSNNGSSGWRGKLNGWLGGDAGLPVDGWLTTCCSQVGQIMLTLPNAYSKVGLLAALPLSIGCACLSFWTMFCLIALYVERKHRLVGVTAM
eukprot:GHUV01005798.1.p2 GENE.GHUV01005798.1~~GHUV01005798.1.p2  ORF type:complete len:155 (+),score=30.50 GHUV01005798.1:518-982(+)